MAGPGLPTTVTAGDTGHVAHTNAVHGIVNKFDTANLATAGFVQIGDGSLFVARGLLSTDNPSIVVNTRTVSYTLVAGDAGKLVEMNVATANTLTVPASVFSAGHIVSGRQYGAGLTTMAAGAGFTIRSRGGVLASAGQYAEWTLTFRSASEAVLSGDLV